jgi:hypothetical protein
MQAEAQVLQSAYLYSDSLNIFFKNWFTTDYSFHTFAEFQNYHLGHQLCQNVIPAQHDHVRCNTQQTFHFLTLQIIFICVYITNYLHFITIFLSF